MLKISLLFFCLLICFGLYAQPKAKTQNLVVVTLDGCRWQDVFRGADSALLFGDKFMENKYPDQWRKLFWDSSKEVRRKKLMPFLWSVINARGQLFGDRDIGSEVSVKNPYNLSYPGYAEIFTGYPDPDLNSNNLVLNPNPNFMEFLAAQPAFKGKVAAFASWDRFPYILNEKRSNFPVNGGYEDVDGKNTSGILKALNAMQRIAPQIISQSSRPDYITYFQAKEYMLLNKPRVFSISLANTDDMAHEGSYGFYLDHLRAMDQYIEDLWDTLQADPLYKDKTTLFITVDHGRGEGEKWTGHGPKVENSNQIWFAILGKGISPAGEVKTASQIYQYQFAQTLSNLLGVKFKSSKETGKAIEL